tara:strand:+ start:482 stop:706 length:225 start_codon:yes stop_codon:yes gene_type:complete
MIYNKINKRNYGAYRISNWKKDGKINNKESIKHEMIEFYYDPIFGCTGWKMEKPKTKTRSKKRKTSIQPKKNKW